MICELMCIMEVNVPIDRLQVTLRITAKLFRQSAPIGLLDR